MNGGPAGSTSWIYLEPDGTLVVEFYDHGPEAEAHFGHDVAFLICVKPQHLPRLDEALGNGDTRLGDTTGVALLNRLAAQFVSYFEVQTWLNEQKIPFAKEFDSWA